MSQVYQKKHNKEAMSVISKSTLGENIRSSKTF